MTKCNKDDEKKGSTGCFIITFLVIVPSALAYAKEGPIGSVVILILGIAAAC